MGAYVHGAGSSYSLARLADEAFKVPSLSRKRVYVLVHCQGTLLFAPPSHAPHGFVVALHKRGW